MEYFEAGRRFAAGVHVFQPEDPAAYAEKKPTMGYGVIRYPEGSVYYGPVFFDGERYHKLGFGRQDFYLSDIGAFDPERQVRRAFYMGQFDYRETDWIYGNGVVYYVDRDNRPACFVKGFYEGLDITEPYRGEFDYSQLPPGFTPDMEAHFDFWADTFCRQMKAREQVRELENIFIGDSYFDLWGNLDFTGKLFYEDFPNEKNLNLGIGGTTCRGWMRFMEQAETLPCPKRVFLNLGFNDIHRQRDPQKKFAEFQILLSALRERFPEAEYHILNVVQCPLHVADAWAEEELNDLIAGAADALNLHIIDMRSTIRENGGVDSCFHADQIHLNAKGYRLMAARVKEITG